jgi:hypothetical protein
MAPEWFRAQRERGVFADGRLLPTQQGHRRLRAYVTSSPNPGVRGREMREGALWPDPLIQLSPSLDPGRGVRRVCDGKGPSR